MIPLVYFYYQHMYPYFLSKAHLRLKTNDNHSNDVESISYFYSKGDACIIHLCSKGDIDISTMFQEALGFLLDFLNELVEVVLLHLSQAHGHHFSWNDLEYICFCHIHEFL